MTAVPAGTQLDAAEDAWLLQCLRPPADPAACVSDLMLCNDAACTALHNNNNNHHLKKKKKKATLLVNKKGEDHILPLQLFRDPRHQTAGMCVSDSQLEKTTCAVCV